MLEAQEMLADLDTIVEDVRQGTSQSLFTLLLSVLH